MKLESQVSSLELSKRLKELGVRQESAFYWCGGDMGGMSVEILGRNGWTESHVHASALTVAELGEMLPDDYGTYKCFAGCREYYGSADYGDGLVDFEPETSDPNEANCRAKMLIHLIEKGIVKP